MPWGLPELIGMSAGFGALGFARWLRLRKRRPGPRYDNSGVVVTAAIVAIAVFYFALYRLAPLFGVR